MIPPNLYGRWRVFASAASAMHEPADAAPISERFLQVLWHYQRLVRERLKTLDGQTVQVLHPGFWNHEAGPDFRNAIIQTGATPPAQGDVEIDLHPHFWKGHHHDRNPAYRSVILQVVWEGDGTAPSGLPVLPLKPFLDAPLGELKLWLGQNPSERFPGFVIGKCAAPLQDLSPEAVNEILVQAAHVRLQAKASQLAARARQSGWEQSLWEGLFGALGYKHNVWAMRRLAELLPMILTQEDPPKSVLDWQARLLGIGGSLAHQLTGRSDVDGYLRRVWDIWWRQQHRYSEVILPRICWRYHGLRPANHPQRRLALAAHWLASADLPARLERWFAASVEDKYLLDSLLEVLQTVRDEFWSWRWTLRSARRAKPQPLLGPQRVTDLAVNAILPWFWVRAAAGQNADSVQVAEHRYFAWPKAEDNAVLRLARQRLFGDRKVRCLGTAAGQQGLLQVVRDFCDHSNALCDQCQFPEMVQELKR